MTEREVNVVKHLTWNTYCKSVMFQIKHLQTKHSMIIKNTQLTINSLAEKYTKYVNTTKLLLSLQLLVSNCTVYIQKCLKCVQSVI